MKTYSGIKQEGILLNANENPNCVSKEILKEIMEAVETCMFHRYPIDTSDSVRETYANFVNVKKEQVLCGNGSDELLGLLIGLHIKKGKKLYTMAPDFSMYDYYVSMHEGKMVKYQNRVNDHFDVDAFITYGKENEIDMILFSNPNNPCGTLIEKEDILKMVEAFPECLVIVDEAYGEFCDMSMVSYVDTYENLLVTRTLSKAFGMAGIRCGFLIGNKKTMETIAPYKVPYNVNTLTQKIAEIAIKHRDEMKRSVEEIVKEREAFYQSFKGRKITLYPSYANYIYGTCTCLDVLKTSFQKENIQIRYYDDAFRITIGKKEDNAKVLNILKKVEDVYEQIC